jgi:predicted dehydrogenase
VKVAFVGTGGVAQRHLGVLAPMSDVQVVGHVSGDAARAVAQAAHWGGAAFARVEDLLEAQRPDAVWICVTPDRHGPLEAALIDARVPFFVEKPLAVDLTTAEAIAARLVGQELIVAVGYKFRALDILFHARKLLAESPPRLVIAAWHDSLPPPDWWRHADQGGGQVVEQATHLLDLARVLVGEAEVISASSGRWPRADAPDADVPDVSAAFLRFVTTDGPIPGMLSATSLLRGHQSIHLQLICAGRSLTLSERALVVDTGQHIEEVLTAADPFQVEDANFLDAVRANNPAGILCSYADALQTHRLAIAIRTAQSA